MNPTRLTKGGAAVYKPSAEEFEAFVENQVRTLLGIDTAAFVEKYRAGTLDRSNPAVSEVAALIEVSQPSHRLSA
jgi:urease accessory protein UreF